jgi:hypothetical protein
MIPLGSLLLGLAFLLATLGSVFAAALIVLRRRLPELAGVPRLVGWSVLATLGLVVAHLVPGILGVLTRESVLAAGLIELAVALAIARKLPNGIRQGDGVPRVTQRAAGDGLWSWAFAMLGAAVFAAFAVAQLKTVGASVPTDTDALSFHIPTVVRWIQTGSMWHYTQYLALQAQGGYPNNGDVVLLALTLPFRSDLLVRGAMPPYLALAGVGIYAIARELGAPAPTSVLVGVAVIATPAAAHPALFDIHTDAMLLAMFAAGMYFLLRHRRTSKRSDLVLAGLALGLAFGTKWYGVSSIPAVLVVWWASRLIQTRSVRAVLPEALLVTGLVVIAGGFWLLRNLVDTGDPLFPLKVAPLGMTIFSAPADVLRQEVGFSIAHYLGSPHILGHFVVPALWQQLGLSTLVILIAALTGGIAATSSARFRTRDGGSMVLVLALQSAVLALIYLITPYTALGTRDDPVQVNANVRYALPAILLAAPLVAWIAGQLGRWRRLLEVALLAGIMDGIRRDFGLHASGTIVVVAVILVGVAWGWPGIHARLARHEIRWLSLGGAALAAVIVAVALSVHHRLTDQPYRSDPVLAWVLEHAATGHRIGVAGQWGTTLSPVLPVFGPRFGNDVGYVGPIDQHMPKLYRDAPGFASALRHGRYDLLVIGRQTPGQGAQEGGWARAAGYRKLAESSRLLLFGAA